MAKKVVFSDLPISQWQAGDTVAVFRNGKVARIPVFGQGDIPEFPKLATVATSGKYSDLTGRPILGTAASKNEGDFATAEQGSKGASAYLWGNHALAGYAPASAVTAANIKLLYESNPDTNVFTDKQKTDLASVFSWGDHRVQGYVLSTDGRLSNAREWTASTVSQSEAETGTATTARKWTAQRVRQAIQAWFLTVSGTVGRTILGRNTSAEVRSDLGLGTAATKNVGTDAGNLMEVGAFGIGRALSYNPDITLEAQHIGGFGSANHVNRTPSDAPDSRIGKVLYIGSASWGTQLWFSYYEGKAWFRNKETGKPYESWKEFIHSGNLQATTGQSATYPMSQKAVTDALNLKQDKLTAGTNISISGNTISATDTTYTTGTLAQLQSGTDTTGRLQTAKNLSDWLNSKGYVTTDTKYSAGNGLTLSGTTFSLPVTVSGSGTYVQSVVQSANGIEVTLGTPPNTTYSEVSQAEAEAGTATTSRLWSAQRVRQSNAAYTYSKAEIDTKINAVDHSALTLAQAQAAALYF